MFKLKNFLFSCCSAQSTNKDTEVDCTSNNTPYKIESPIPSAQGNSNKYYATDRISDLDITKGPKLKLIAIEGSLIPINTEFIINAGGLINGGRSKQDGETYIGHLANKKGDKANANDIVLEDFSVGPQHSLIKYDPERRKYFLQDLGEGSGTFIKIEEELELKSGYIVSFSDSHMLIHTRDDNMVSEDDQKTTHEDKKGNITIKFLDGPKVDQVYRFKSEDKQIKIGRMNDCHIKFDDNNLSRYQCTFKYVNNAWYIIDGVKNKPSTNGTWLLVDNTVELFHQMIVKIGQTLFKIEIIPGAL